MIISMPRAERAVNRALPILPYWFIFFLLFSMFNFNAYNVAEDSWYANFQVDSENAVFGRIVASRQEGVFSHGGLLGRYSEKGKENSPQTALLMQIYEKGVKPKKHVWLGYQPQIGLQGLLFSLVDKLLPPHAAFNLDFYHAMVSFFNAAVITALIYWIGLEMGLGPVLGIGIGLFASPWLIIFGRNLYLLLGLYFLPTVIMAYGFRRIRFDKKPDMRNIMIAFFAAFLFKCACGLEFLTNIVLAAWIPIIYYALLDRWTWRRFVTVTLTMGSLSLLACFIALFVNALMLMNHEHWSFGTAALALLGHAQERMGFHPTAPNLVPVNPAEDPNSFVVGILPVLMLYMGGMLKYALASTSPIDWPMTFGGMMVVAFAMSFIAALVIHDRGQTPYTRYLKVLIVCTWVSLGATWSWIILARQHAYVHAHIDYILWYVPFMFFCFALCGEIIFGALVRRYMPAFAHPGYLASKPKASPRKRSTARKKLASSGSR